MKLVNRFIEHRHLPYLLDIVHRRMQQDLARVVGVGAFPELRGSHFRLLAMVPAEGARPSELAATAHITRPALGELVRHLEDNGYLESRDDTSDRRAVIVRRTELGDRAAAAADEGIAELRRQWSSEIGEPRFDAMMDALAALATGNSGSRKSSTAPAATRGGIGRSRLG